MTKNKSWSVRQTKDQRHQHNPAHFGSKRGSQVRLNEGAKEKFFD